VVSRQRLYDILRLLGKEDLKIINRTVATQVAEKAGVRWILTGELLRTEPDITITSDISEAETGEIVASQRITADTDEEIFAVVDRLSAKIREDLSLPAAARTERDRPVAEVTTHSPEAYRYFMEGFDYENRFYEKQAAESYKKAIEFDSTFAMAYYRLAYVGHWQHKKERIAKAVEYLDKASWKEKHYIRAAAAGADDTTTFFKELRKIVERDPDDKDAVTQIGVNYYGAGHYATAIRYLERAIEIDPLYKSAYNSLAYAYHSAGSPDKAVWAINKYIDLAPDEHNPYDTRGDLYREDGRLEEAAESYVKANTIRQDWWDSLLKLGYTYLYLGEYGKADSCFRRLASSDDEDWRTDGRTWLARAKVYQGKFEEALAMLDDGLAADRMDKAPEWGKVRKQHLKAKIHMHRHDPVTALREFEIYMEMYQKENPDDKFWPLSGYAMFLANTGDFEKAGQVAEEIEKNISEEWHSNEYSYTLGYIERARGNYEEARIHFEKIPEEDRGFSSSCRLGHCYLELERLEEAVACFEKVLSIYSGGRAWAGAELVKAYYLLGMCYEKSGWNKRAIEQYETFLDIWRDADSGIPEVEDARQRLAGLKAET
jgi:tetratricopeptide (TPR) repeat protein